MVLVHSGSDVKKTAKFFDVSFLNFHIYFVSEQGNRFGAKVISLGYLGYLNFQTSYFLSFLKLSVQKGNLLSFLKLSVW